MESAEKIPKNFAPQVDTGPVRDRSLRDRSLRDRSLRDSSRETLQRVGANLHLAVSGASFAQPLVTKPAVAISTAAGKPEQVGLGGKDGSFLSCLRVPGVSGYLIVC